MTNPNVSLIVLYMGCRGFLTGPLLFFCRSSWKWKSWISGGIRNGIRTGMRTTVVGSRRVVVLMAMTPTISTPRTTIITHIFHSHLSPPHRQDGIRIFCLGLTPPHLSLSLFKVVGCGTLLMASLLLLFCRSSWKWKGWISGRIRTGMPTSVVGTPWAVVLMAMT